MKAALLGRTRPPAPPDDELSGSPFRLASGSSPYNLIDRITYSATPFETALMDKLGWNGYLEYHLKPAAIDESALESALTEFATLDVTPFENIRYLSYNQGFDIYYEMGSARILRATFARRQLLEVMTEFWLDHFNVFSNKIWHEFLPTYERTIRKYALSDFKTLLTQVVKSGAMLFYLDNTQNEIGRHNENFARELLELHSLGVDNGYWEADIYTARRCFTGWNFEGYYEWPWQNTTNPSWGQFRFYEDRHDREGGYFLGTTLNDYIAKGGVEQGELILAKVAAHSSTAYHLSKKLCQKFLGENVSETFINSAAAVFKSSKGDIRTVLRFILKQSNFEANYQPKYKRPFHFTISAMRATNASIPDTGDVLYNILQAMRQQPFQWAPPNGYPDAYAAWVDNLSPRWARCQRGGNELVLGRSHDRYVSLYGQSHADRRRRLHQPLSVRRTAERGASDATEGLYAGHKPNERRNPRDGRTGPRIA